jgi:beta propeller repeat protein
MIAKEMGSGEMISEMKKWEFSFIMILIILVGMVLPVTAAGGKIAFTSDRDGNTEIYLMNPDGTAQTRITDNPAIDEVYSWSPDSTKIAFWSNRSNNIDVYVMNLDGTGQTRLTSNSQADVYPAWSPNGTKIAFMSTREGNEKLFVMNTDGTGQTRITNDTANSTNPNWAPDGSKIAFRSDRDGNYEIYVMNPDGTNQVRLTNNSSNPIPSSRYNMYPTWSPDGSKITFMSTRDGDYNIYIMNPDGTNQTRLTNNPASDTRPDWSPDGSKIVFCSSRDGNSEIYTMNPDGTRQTRITNNPALESTPFWGAPPMLAAGFTVNATAGTAPLAVAFTDSSFGNNITAWSWNFGDGSSLENGTSSTNPVHTYAVGTWYPRLTITNASGSSTSAITGARTITVTDAPANHAPVANNQTVRTDENYAIGITLNATDPDGNSLLYTIVSGPSHGALTGTAPSLIYKPNSNYNGTDSFTFKANDGSLDSNIATISISIKPITYPNIIPICTNPAIQSNPLVSNEAIFWQDSRSGKMDFYAWDPVHGEQRVTTNASDHINPAISGNTIVWQDHRNGNWDIYKWDTVHGERQITNNLSDQTNPAISGDIIVWTDYRGFEDCIYMWDPVNGERRISVEGTGGPLISGYTVVFYGHYTPRHPAIAKWDPVNGEQEIFQCEVWGALDLDEIGKYVISGDTIAFSHTHYSYDDVGGSPGSLETVNHYIEIFDPVWGGHTIGPLIDPSDPIVSGDTILWQDSRSGKPDYYKWDPVHGERVTSNSSDHINFAMSGDTIVWQDHRNGNWDIYKWDPVHGEQQVTNELADQTNPAIYGDTIAWVDNRNGNADIFATLDLAGTISVTSPNGGEVWNRGTTQTVAWDYAGNPGTTVKITRLQGGVEVGTIADSTSTGSGGKGSYTWSILPFGSTGTNCQVKIQSINQPLINDNSNKNFTLAPVGATPPSITITSPNGGETWKRGTTHTVTWDYTGNPGTTVKITRLQGGVQVGSISSSTSIGTGGHGSYKWSISPTGSTGSDCKIFIQSLSQPAIIDTSDNSFTLAPVGATPPSITITSPNGGETWKRGTTQTVTWDYIGDPGTTVKITRLQGSVEVGTISASTSIGTGGHGSFVWSIGATGTTGNNCQVKIQSISQPTINDSSNNSFTLAPAGPTPPTITVTSPNGGETWKRGTTQTVTWDYSGNPGSYVKITRLQGDVEVGTISTSTSIGTGGHGSYVWNMGATGTTGTNCRVKIQSISQPTVSDVSNNYFTLTF